MDMFSIVRQVSMTIDDDRTVDDVLTHTMEELGELVEEVQLSYGFIKGKAGPDGIVGESIDILACVLDMIYVVDPSFSNYDYEAMFGVCEHTRATHELSMKITVDIGKLATEVKIAKGRSYKVSTEDGVVRKCVDVARHCWSLIYSDFISKGNDWEDMDNRNHHETMKHKCLKWKTKVNERLEKERSNG